MSTVLHNALLPTYPQTRVTFVDGDGERQQRNRQGGILPRRHLDWDGDDESEGCLPK